MSEASSKKKKAASPISAAGPSLASKILVILLIVVSVIFIVWMAVSAIQQLTYGRAGAKIDKDAYQAVFLTNQQVYFGKLSQIDSDYLKLTDIYYPQVSQSIQEVEDDPETEVDESATQPEISLRKLGNELYGPQDEMYISRDQVLYWENLQDAKDEDGNVTSRVVEAIEKHKAEESEE